MPEATTETSARAPLAPVSAGYADVNGIKLYHEIYGQGEPLVLLHGGLMTIGEMLTPLEPVAKTHKVIAVELQGHGRTADTDRPLSFETMGDDIAALLNQLNISKADIVGLSLGAAVGLRTAIQHPEKVRRLVVISSPYAKSGWYPEAQEGMGKRQRRHGRKHDADAYWEILEAMARAAALPAIPRQDGQDDGRVVRLVRRCEKTAYAGDAGLRPQRLGLAEAHCGVFRSARRRREGARLAEHPALEGAAAIVGYSHYNFASAPELAPIIDKYLADPPTNPPAGAAAASQVAPERTKSN